MASICETRSLVQEMLNQCVLAELDYPTTFHYFDDKVLTLEQQYADLVSLFKRNEAYINRVSSMEGAWQFTPYDISVIRDAIVILNNLLWKIANGTAVPDTDFSKAKLIECGLKYSSVYGQADTSTTGYYGIILDHTTINNDGGDACPRYNFVVPVDEMYVSKMVEENNPDKQCLYINTDAVSYPSTAYSSTDGWKIITAKNWDIVGSNITKPIVPKDTKLPDGTVVKRATFDIYTKKFGGTTATITFDEGSITPVIDSRTTDITWANCGFGWYKFKGGMGFRLNTEDNYNKYTRAFGQPIEWSMGYGYIAKDLHIVSIVDNAPEAPVVITGLPAPQFYEVKSFAGANTYYYYDSDMYQPVTDSFTFYDNGRDYWYYDTENETYVSLNITNDSEYQLYRAKYGQLYVSPTEGYIPVKTGESYVETAEEFAQYLSKYGKLYCRYWQLFLHTYDPTYDVYEHFKESTSVDNALYMTKFWRGRFSKHQDPWTKDLSNSRVLDYIGTYKWDKVLSDYVSSFYDVTQHFNDPDKTLISHELLFKHIPVNLPDDDGTTEAKSKRALIYKLLFQLGNIWAVRHELIRVFYGQLLGLIEEGNGGIKLK